MIDLLFIMVCAVISWRFNRDLHRDIFDNNSRIYEVWSADTNRLDGSGGPYKVKTSKD